MSSLDRGAPILPAESLADSPLVDERPVRGVVSEVDDFFSDEEISWEDVAGETTVPTSTSEPPVSYGTRMRRGPRLRRGWLVVFLVLILGLAIGLAVGLIGGNGTPAPAPSSTPRASRAPRLPVRVAPIVVLSTGRLLGPGSRGARVGVLQRALAELGQRVGKPDGIYGRRTTGAVRAFQRAHGLAADGVVGAATVSRLNAALAKTTR